MIRLLLMWSICFLEKNSAEYWGLWIDRAFREFRGCSFWGCMVDNQTTEGCCGQRVSWLLIVRSEELMS
ncbi:Uncharacterised protein [Kluyvera cryocrescens]|uniref:Uncharacterized protein n=1 Tax=Kluyvera cryocrescens TaxID=580 RepID=A0A485B2X2_KLUCR|nr:Uncharacterised protein [Kluyvera cryocrescens]